ncbi:MAG: hypothetical protein IT576_02930 [Verrucomicrobiales bacterium]|nr:hypothetical protein [Verrucomicrobiales bacterium]
MILGYTVAGVLIFGATAAIGAKLGWFLFLVFLLLLGTLFAMLLIRRVGKWARVRLSRDEVSEGSR